VPSLVRGGVASSALSSGKEHRRPRIRARCEWLTMSCRVRVGVYARYLFDNKIDSNEVMIALAGRPRLLYDVGMH
jgi:hypothetical protein